MIKKAFILIFLSCYTFLLLAQPAKYGPQLEVGKPMPDFLLNNVTHFKKKQANLKDFNGKWLIFDFWSLTCIPCIQKMPEVNRLQNKFAEKVQFVLVGLNSYQMTLGSGPRIVTTYEKIRQKYNLQLPSAYDSIMFIRWGIWSFPTVVIVSPEGIVTAITSSKEINEQTVDDLVNGKQVDFRRKDKPKPDYNADSLSARVTQSIISRSILSKGIGEGVTLSRPIEYLETGFPKKGIEFIMQPLSRLYITAYFGDWWPLDLLDQEKYPEPIIEVKDSSLFQFDYDKAGYPGLYNYNVIVDSSHSKNLSHLKRVMQQDLNNVFGFAVSIERKEIPVYSIVALPNAAKKLKSGLKLRPGPQVPYIDVSLTNVSIAYLRKYLYAYHSDLPLFDDTGINGEINFQFEGSILELEDIKKSLQNHRLDLIKTKKIMDVVVIKDPK